MTLQQADWGPDRSYKRGDCRDFGGLELECFRFQDSGTSFGSPSSTFTKTVRQARAVSIGDEYELFVEVVDGKTTDIYVKVPFDTDSAPC